MRSTRRGPASVPGGAGSALDRANHTGTQAASTIDDFSGDVTFKRHATAQLRITPATAASSSFSQGGALNIQNSANTGAGMVVYTTAGPSNGHLAVFRVDSATFDKNAIYCEHSGVSHAATFNYTGTNSNSSAVNVASSNPNMSAMQVSGTELGTGSLKISHTGTGTDGSAAGVSIDLKGTGTAAQGLFITSTTGGTTGNLITVRHNGRDDFVVKADGMVGIRKPIAATSAGALDISQADDSTVGIAMTANSGSAQQMVLLKDSGGNARFEVSATGNAVMRATAFFTSNIQVGAASQDLGGGLGPMIGLKNASTVPSTNPTNGVILYSEAGVLKYRDPSGAVTALGAGGSSSNTIAPTANGLIAWSFDPVSAVNNSLLTTGVLYLTRINLGTSATISNVLVQVITAGAGLTAGQNFAALFDNSGNQVAITADQSGVWNSPGSKTMAFTSPYSAAAGTFWIALLANGTTGPALARSVGTAVGNIGLSAGNYRFATSGTGQISVPGTVTLGSAGNSAVGLWVGVS